MHVLHNSGYPVGCGMHAGAYERRNGPVMKKLVRDKIGMAGPILAPKTGPPCQFRSLL